MERSLDYQKNTKIIIQESEMKFLRKTKGCTKLDHVLNKTIIKELDMESKDE